ncbi:hypothetical protein LAZ67_X003775 [Cordylochernes scorpioides]|uniref:CCHC-type domain-containing protein n=1 Tax=Cordylochernes scorpioides TaxID=51811 RepID=A0ABY6LUD8_9ARAC|nr:hypothetical protein LAZ67_X003775 [Cordylochernes scorpioides]
MCQSFILNYNSGAYILFAQDGQEVLINTHLGRGEDGQGVILQAMPEDPGLQVRGALDDGEGLKDDRPDPPTGPVALIRKLPQDYDGIVQVLYRLEEKHFNVENIEAHLITESGRVQQKKKDDGLDIVANAYQTKTPRMYQGNKKKNYFSAKAQYSSGSMLEPTVHPRTARTYDIRNCSFCGKTGHLIKDCFLRNKNSEGQHYRKDQNYRGKSSAFHSEILSFHHISERASDPTSEWGEWLIDSAATSHFCKEKDWFVNYQDIPPMDALIGDVDCKSTILDSKIFRPQSILKVNSSPINWTDQVKYLGVTLNYKLIFNMQPMDKGVIKNLKHFYRRFLVENILTGDSEALKIKLDVLQASRLCKKAWDQVTSETIKHCFKKAGFVKKEEDEENADVIIAETMPSVDGWEDVISNPTISYDDFLNVDDDVAVCGEITDADIIAEVLNHNIEKQDGDEASGDEDESSVAGEMNVPSAAEATNYIMQLRRFFESKNDT